MIIHVIEIERVRERMRDPGKTLNAPDSSTVAYSTVPHTSRSRVIKESSITALLTIAKKHDRQLIELDMSSLKTNSILWLEKCLTLCTRQPPHTSVGISMIFACNGMCWRNILSTTIVFAASFLNVISILCLTSIRACCEELQASCPKHNLCTTLLLAHVRVRNRFPFSSLIWLKLWQPLRKKRVPRVCRHAHDLLFQVKLHHH